MIEFVKIFKIDECQVLVFKDQLEPEDPDERGFLITAITHTRNGYRGFMEVETKSLETADIVFDGFDENIAWKFYERSKRGGYHPAKKIF